MNIGCFYYKVIAPEHSFKVKISYRKFKMYKSLNNKYERVLTLIINIKKNI